MSTEDENTTKSELTVGWNPVKNLLVNLHAAGPAAVLCVMVICITLLGLYGQGILASTALGILGVSLAFLGGALVSRIW
jgi:hypothetical protein